MKPYRSISLVLAISAVAILTRGLTADEGMWPLNRFPTAPDPEEVRLYAGRAMARAGAARVRTAPGLFRQHRVVLRSRDDELSLRRRCVESLSSKDKNLLETGFSAASPAEERICPGVQINQLTAIADVTERVAAGTKGAEGEAFAKARQAVFATIERECATGDDVTCEVVTLYRGGKYDLVQIPPFLRRPPGVRTRVRHRVLRRGSRQLHVPALQPRSGLHAALRGRRSGAHRPIGSPGRPPAHRPATSSSSPVIRGPRCGNTRRPSSSSSVMCGSRRTWRTTASGEAC